LRGWAIPISLTGETANLSALAIDQQGRWQANQADGAACLITPILGESQLFAPQLV
jgi:hypothetical protein